jgi:arylsulfatase
MPELIDHRDVKNLYQNFVTNFATKPFYSAVSSLSSGKVGQKLTRSLSSVFVQSKFSLLLQGFNVMQNKVWRVLRNAGATTLKLTNTMVSIVGVSTVSALGISLAASAQTDNREKQSSREDDRPNIVLLIADDMGYADVEAYGGDVVTPNISELAEEGLQFTNYHVGPSCSPTRSMLLTGLDNHLAGLGQMLENLTPNQVGLPGYEGVINDRSLTIPQLLQDNGYHTYMVGKWHLGGAEIDEETGKEIGKHPSGQGFERSFALLEGGGDHYSNRGFSPTRPINHFSQDGVRMEDVPADFKYSTDFYRETMTDFIESNRKDGKPFYAYMAFTAPHTPLQVPDKALIDKYAEFYSQGWDVIREQRFERMKEMGIIPADTEYRERFDETPPWDELSPQRKLREARRMGVYAAMIEYLDGSIGEFMDYLKETGEYDNTIFVFMSDNGADGHDRSRQDVYKEWYQKIGVDNSLENMGLPNSFVSRGVEWGQVSGTPFRAQKATTAEGGTRANLILYYPGMIEGGEMTDVFATVKDLAPTLLDYADVEHPGSSYKGREIHPLSGRSMRPFIEGDSEYVYGPDEPVAIELGGTINDSLFMGDWKLLRIGDEEWGDGEWELFNVAEDPGELNNLAAQEPQRLLQMRAAYEQFLIDVGWVPAAKKK